MPLRTISDGESGNTGPTPTHPVCVVCDGAGCEFCPGTYLALAMAAVFDGRPGDPIEIGDGIYVRAEVVVRNVVPAALENLEARNRLVGLRKAS